jgi:hypothetical protein
MSDDLVKLCKRLSKHAHAQLSSADLESIANRIEGLEAQLAKAVAFIEFLDENYRHVWGETARLKIRTLHAELTGGKDE